MNRKIRQLAGAFMVLYVVLFAAINYWQVGRESELNAMGGNTRAIRREFSRPRGEIVSADGVVAAESIALPDDNEFPYQRQYPTGELFANVTGYYSLASAPRSWNAPRTPSSPARPPSSASATSSHDSTARRLHEIPDDPTMAERWAARRLRRHRPRTVARHAG